MLYHVTGEVENYIDFGTVETILRGTGWPSGVVSEALDVISCESGGNQRVSMYELTNGSMTGMFQIYPPTWASYCGVTHQELLNPITNSACALEIYQYDQERQNPDWFQWACKP